MRPKFNAEGFAEKLVSSLNLPHLRDGGCWRLTYSDPVRFIARERLIDISKSLHSAGVPDDRIIYVIESLYWDSVCEFALNQKARDKAKAKEFLRNHTGQSMTGYEAASASGQMVRMLPDSTALDACPKCGELPNLAYPCEQCGGLPNLTGDELQ